MIKFGDWLQIFSIVVICSVFLKLLPLIVTIVTWSMGAFLIVGMAFAAVLVIAAIVR